MELERKVRFRVFDEEVTDGIDLAVFVKIVCSG